MKTETLKDWIKSWDIRMIVNSCVSEGMLFIADKTTEEDLQKFKKIVAKELEYRITNIKTEKVTRVEIIDDEGRQYVNTNAKNVKLSLQDEERTLKIFINRE